MDKQMELFDDGGLMEEGGMVDEVSGNDVPPGSTREEVRDDIPAQLSEGEFVFPADVVRYVGLENLMRMRQEAKMGLAQMEAMGQMGNSEEATMPDDLPFDMYDLEVEDDDVQDFAQGGVVQAAQGMYVPPQIGTTNIPQPSYGIAGYQPSQFTSYGQQPIQPSQPFQSVAPVGSYTPPTQQFTPTQTGAVPSFKAFTTPQSVTYYNADGRTIQIPVDANGNPLIPVPAGFNKTKPDATTDITKGTGTGSGGISVIQNDDNDSVFTQTQKTLEERQDKIAAAEAMGFTEKQSTVEALLPYAISAFGGPLGSLAAMQMKPEEGTILPDGTVADGKGNSFDPISGEQVGIAGGALGAISKALGFSKPEDMPESLKEKIGLSDAQRADMDLEFERNPELAKALDNLSARKDVTVETTQVTKTGKATEVTEKGIAEYAKQLGITPEEIRKKMAQSPDIAENVERIGQLVEKGATVKPDKPSAAPAETKRVGTDTYGLNDDFTILNSQDISKNRRDAGKDPYKDTDIVYTSEVYNTSTGRTETIEYNVHGIGKNSRGQTTFASGNLKTDAKGRVVNAEIPGSKPSGGRDNYTNDSGSDSSGSGTSSDGPSGGYDAGDTYSGKSDDFSSSGDWGSGGIGAPGLAKGGLAKQMEKSGLTPKK